MQITSVAQGWLKMLLALGTLQLAGIFQTLVLGQQVRPGSGSVVSHLVPQRDPLVTSSGWSQGSLSQLAVSPVVLADQEE